MFENVLLQETVKALNFHMFPSPFFFYQLSISFNFVFLIRLYRGKDCRTDIFMGCVTHFLQLKVSYSNSLQQFQLIILALQLTYLSYICLLCSFLCLIQVKIAHTHMDHNPSIACPFSLQRMKKESNLQRRFLKIGVLVIF